jgi:hypothetical protein
LAYEKLFVASLCVKYYLWGLTHKSSSTACLSDLYDLDFREVNCARLKVGLSTINIDLSKGISLPDSEAFVFHKLNESAITHNSNIHNAHHDIIIPARISGSLRNIPVSAKCSFTLSPYSCILNQLKQSNVSETAVLSLIWLYLGEWIHLEDNYPQVIFLNGSGCCNGLSLDLFILVKKLKSLNNVRT